jgi:mRNA-degrading endonuclease RelE of RelBE toxin-antitoxin system
MPYTIEIALKAFQRVELLDVIDQHLTHTPTIISRSRIKRLRLLDSPAYRLRVGDYRVYYDVDVDSLSVKVLRILSKAASLDYLRGVGGKE